MSRAHGLILSFAALLAAAGCASRSDAQVRPAAAAAETPTPAEDNGQQLVLDGLTTELPGDGPFRYGGYELVKRVKRTQLPSGHTRSVEYAVLRKNGRQVGRFNAYDVPPTEAYLRFGVFPLLGQEPGQLIIEQVIHRGWRYWVVDPAQEARVVFDNADYPVGHDLRAKDLDGDGRYELIQSLHSFWFLNHRTSNVNSPLIDIVFRYDEKSRKYVPANREFQDYVLRDIESLIDEAREAKAKVRAGGPDYELFGEVLEVVITYLYAGKEKEGWDFFEEYDLPDREAMRADIKGALAGDKVYAAVRKSARDEARAMR